MGPTSPASGPNLSTGGRASGGGAPAGQVYVLADRETVAVGTITDATATVAADGFEAATGWHLEDRGLCRGDLCVPTGGHQVATADGEIDLTAAAQLLDRPLVTDPATSAVAIGAPRADRQRALRDLEAPDFELPDLAGTPHRLADWHGRKRLLVAFATW